MLGRSPVSAWVAIPARNEEERLPSCLHALAAQQGATVSGVVVLLNNCTDRSECVLKELAPSLPFPLDIISVEMIGGNVGLARRQALLRASEYAGKGGALLTTDADTVAPPSWLADNLSVLAAGADACCGRAVIDPIEAMVIPASLHADDAHERSYAALIDELRAILDPDPIDPWPRHDEESGASLAVWASVHDAVGGAPPLPLAEDRAFVAALRRADAKIRHAPEVWVTVSGRLVGRASGGMADTMRRRMAKPDVLLDERLEPVADAARRFHARALLRDGWRNGATSSELISAFGLAEAELSPMLRTPTFGAAWQAAELRSPRLQRHRMPASALVTEMPRAIALLNETRRRRQAIDRCDL